MKDIKEMTYEEWCEYQEQRERELTKNSELVSEDEPYFIHIAVVDYCFSEEKPLLQFAPIYWMSEEMIEEHPDAFGIAGYGAILFNKERWEEENLHTRISAMFHEMLHLYCRYRDIKATSEDGYHLRAFAEAAEKHGGRCTLSADGWTEATLTEETMKKVLSYLRKKGVE